MSVVKIKPSHAQLKQTHPLAQGLVLELPFFYDVRDYSGNGHHGIFNGSAMGTGSRGRALVHDATTDYTDFGASGYLPTDDVTIAIFLRKHDATNRATGTFSVQTDTDAERCYAAVPWSDGVVYWDWGGFTGDTRITASGLTFGDDLWVFTAGPRGMEIWQNGVKRASNTANNTRSASTGAFKLGSVVAEGTNVSDLVDYSLLRMHDRQLSEREITSLVRDPWQIYDDEDETDWIAAVAAAITASNNYLHASLPYPIYGARYTLILPYLDADGDPTDPVTPDTEITKDPTAAFPTFTDTTNEIVILGNGLALWTASSKEMECAIAAVVGKVASGPKNTLATLKPRRLPIISSGTLVTGEINGGTLATGFPTYDLAGCYFRTTRTGAGANLFNEARKIHSYNTLTGAFTVADNFVGALASGFPYDILLPEGVTPGMLKALNPTTPGSKLDVTLTGAAGIDWSNVENQTATVNLNNTRLRLHADYDLYDAIINWTRDQSNAKDEWTIVWRKDGILITSGITSPTIRVYKRADGTNLIPTTAVTEIGSTQTFKLDESVNRLVFGEAVVVIATATIDGASRTFTNVKSDHSV